MWDCFEIGFLAFLITQLNRAFKLRKQDRKILWLSQRALMWRQMLISCSNVLSLSLIITEIQLPQLSVVVLILRFESIDVCFGHVSAHFFEFGITFCVKECVRVIVW